MKTMSIVAAVPVALVIREQVSYSSFDQFITFFKAYTFLTEEEGKYAGDIIKALEMSKTEVPKHLENLWERYKLDQERLGKTVQKSSGFSGSGFKFDEAENQMDKDRKNMQKQALGYHVSLNWNFSNNLSR